MIMNDLRVYVDGSMIPVKDLEVTVSPQRQASRVQAVVGVSPSLGPDGQHRHVSRRGTGGVERQLVAESLGGVLLAPLIWVDTDQVSECPSDCGHDHETWYVQKLVCPVCEVTLQPLNGEDQIWVRSGTDVRLSFTFLDESTVATEVDVHGLGDQPVTVHGEVSSSSWIGAGRWHFEGTGRS